MVPDRELLRQYAAHGSEAALAEIVRRHVDLVYGAARRQLCGNGSLAEEVAQEVFTILAVKARTPPPLQHLAAWLYTTTRFTVSHTVRTERRRQVRDQQAQTLHAFLQAENSSGELEIPAELLDDVLAGLDEADREIVLLRFFEGRSFAAIGAAQDVSEDAARMRVTRSLEKIRAQFAQRGIGSSAAALGALLTGQIVAAPAGLATSIVTTALASTTVLVAAGGAKVGLISLMSTKGITWLTSTVAVLALGYSGYESHLATVERDSTRALAAERDRLQEELRLSEESLAQANQRAATAAQALAEAKRPPVVAAATPPTAKPAKPAKRFPGEPDEKQQLIADKLAQMKPLLAAGQAIKGVIVILEGGKPVEHPVAFVMGQETRVPVGDDGTYILLPTLNPDGTVKYSISLQAKNTAEDPEKRPTVINFPWSGFGFGDSEGKALAFDPDETGP
jgi:RNA polymerase sigma factor (sigma-70 family)